MPGAVLAMAPLASLTSAWALGAVADRGHRRVALMGALVGSFLLRWLLLAVPPTTAALCAVVLLYESVGSPIYGSIDAALVALYGQLEAQPAVPAAAPAVAADAEALPEAAAADAALAEVPLTSGLPGLRGFVFRAWPLNPK